MLHVMLASEAPIGLVLRRGPSKRVCTVLWARRNDKFRLGQWLKGRIYEWRSDLSPTGEYLLCHVRCASRHAQDLEEWTAISRAPYLKAIAFFPDARGGLFTARDTYRFYGSPFEEFPAPDHPLHRETGELRCERDCPARLEASFLMETAAYLERLRRGGWILREQELTTSSRLVFEKPAREGWVLRKTLHCTIGGGDSRSLYWDTHDLFHPETGRATRGAESWEWADIDGDRLVWAEGGQLLAAALDRGGMTRMVELHDFNAMTFGPVEAPY